MGAPMSPKDSIDCRRRFLFSGVMSLGLKSSVSICERSILTGQAFCKCLTFRIVFEPLIVNLYSWVLRLRALVVLFRYEVTQHYRPHPGELVHLASSAERVFRCQL